jgi:hypothetical protein
MIRSTLYMPQILILNELLKLFGYIGKTDALGSSSNLGIIT